MTFSFLAMYPTPTPHPQEMKKVGLQVNVIFWFLVMYPPPPHRIEKKNFGRCIFPKGRFELDDVSPSPLFLHPHPPEMKIWTLEVFRSS